MAKELQQQAEYHQERGRGTHKANEQLDSAANKEVFVKVHGVSHVP